MDENLIHKIAGKLVLSFNCRVFVKESNFNNDSEKGIVLFNYRYYPILWAYPENDHVKVFYSRDEKESYDKVRYHICINPNSFISRFKNYLSHYSQTINNFRKGLCNKILQNGPESDWDFLIKYSTNMSIQEFKNLMVTKYDVMLSKLEKIFGSQENSENKIIKTDKVIFKCENDMEIQYINDLYDGVNKLLAGSKLSETIYGTVEIKHNFVEEITGDYSSSQDIIRTGGELQRAISTFIHELGHRWYYKFASRQQISEFKKLYDNCNGKHIVLQQGDKIKYNFDNNEYIYLGIQLGDMKLKKIIDEKIYYAKKKWINSIIEINGQKVEKYNFPSNYSQKKFIEFIPECIKYAYCNKPMDEQLKEKVKQIIEG